MVATGRGDFPNQVNNSIGFPGILKGALLVKARKITDNMAIAAARSLAAYAETKGLSPESIVPHMEDDGVFPVEARDVALQAIADGVARVQISGDEVYQRTAEDIRTTRKIFDMLIREEIIKRPSDEIFQQALQEAIAAVTNNG